MTRPIIQRDAARAILLTPAPEVLLIRIQPPEGGELDKRFCQREQYHVIHVTRFGPRMSDAREMHVVDRFRWWPVPELAHASERLTPLSLAAMVARYLKERPPRDPPDVEVLVD